MRREWMMGMLVPMFIAAGPALAAGSHASTTRDDNNNGVPGVDMNVSSHDRGSDANNGVPGVDVNVSGHDRGSNTNNGVPGVDVDTSSTVSGNHAAVGARTRSNRGDDRAEARQDATEQVAEASKVIAKMKHDPDLKQAMRKAKGIFVMPDYARGALGVGVHGSNGVLLVKNNGKWSGPALYNMGGVSIGLQAGGSAGQAAFLLMSDKAVRQFEQNNDFALNADAGITVLPWTAKAHARTGGDVVAWSGQGGLYAGASIGVTDINFDEHETAALYGRKVTPKDIIEGRAQTPMAASLQRELSFS